MADSVPTALVVSAHAADFVWRCGGAIALHASRGWQVHVVCLSFGERGESAKLWKQPGATLEKVKAVRRAEAERAAAELGVHALHAFDLGDYPLRFTPEAELRLVRLMREIQPRFVLTHALEDPYNPDHPATARFVIACRSIAQAWGHEPGGRVLGAPQVYFFEPHQSEQCGFRPDTLLDITPVWERKWAAIRCMEGQEHLWAYYRNVAENRGNQFRRNSGGQAGGRDCRYAEAFQSLYPRTVDEL